MADASRRKAAQPAHASNILGFGHFGTATYDEEASKWSFLRAKPGDDVDVINETAGQPSFRLIKLSAQDPVVTDSPDASTTEPTRVSTNQIIKALPEAAPSICSYGSNLTASPLLFDRQSLDSGSITFASALVLGNEGIRSGFQLVPVTVRVLSRRPDTLVMTLMNSETVTVEVGDMQQIQVPCISSERPATWHSKRGSIRQVRASATSSSQEATWLAVRLATATTIFQLLHRTIPRSSNRPSLGFNLVVEMPISRTGGQQHTDVVFHPQDPRRFAIIDSTGSWSVWSITGTRAHSMHIPYRAQLDFRGSCAPEPGPSVLWDDWHRIAWINNAGQHVSHLLVANRHSLFLFDTAGSLLSRKDMCIGNREHGWILDILLPPSTVTDFLVITMTYIFWMNVDALTEHMGDSARPHESSVIACWKHLYEYTHASQNLNAIWFSQAVWLFATSAKNQVITTYRCTRSENADIDKYQVSDPVRFNVPLTQTNNARCLNLQLVQSSQHYPTGHDKSNGQFYFLKAFYQVTNGNIQELLCLLIDSDAGKPLDMVLLPKNSFLQRKSTFRASQVDDEEDMSDFIVSDNENDFGVNIPNGDVALSASQTTQVVPNVSIGANDPRTCDLQRTYDTVTTQIHLSVAKTEAIRNSVVESMHKLKGNLSTARTLFDLISDVGAGSAHVAEIENDSQMLEHWVQELGKAGSDSELEQLASSRILEDESLIDIYDRLVDRWMSTLSEEIPDRVRVQRERILRQVALEIYLSSVLIKPEITNSSQDAEENVNISEFASSTLSLRMSQLETESVPTSPSLASSQTLVQPEARPSLLSQYVTFKQPVATTAKATAAINSIMAHLPVSADVNPVAYNFNNTELDVALTMNELTTQEMDAKSRRKAERLARARKKQLEKQAQLRKSAFEQANALPTIMSSQLPIRAIQSSQVGPVASSQLSVENIPQVSMTQPERGTFGKRELKKTKSKGKARQKGF